MALARALPQRAFPLQALLGHYPDAVLFVAFFALSTQGFGPLPILILFPMLALLIALKPVELGITVLRWAPLLATPLLAIVSFIWSDTPALSARYAVQLTLTCLLGIYLARLMTPDRFLRVLLLSIFAFCVLGLASGRVGISMEGPVPIGLTGSKNQMGFVAQFLLIAAIGVALLPKTPRPFRIVSLLAVPLAIYLLISVRATGALMLAMAGAGIMCVYWVMQRLTPGGRLAIIIGAVLIITPLLLIIPEITHAYEDILASMGKDATLTGRTYLWERAAELSQQRPLLGFGYQAIWVGESANTIGLLRWAGLEDGRTFNFHNTFIQLRVDLGIVGMGTFIATLVVVSMLWVKQFFLRPSMESLFFFTLFLLFVARSFVELIFAPFSSYTMLFFACCVYALREAPKAAVAANPVSAQIRRPA